MRLEPASACNEADLFQAIGHPWVQRIYGARFDRNTEQYIPQAHLELAEKRFVYQDTIKLIVARTVTRSTSRAASS